jgi:hypothetical protein
VRSIEPDQSKRNDTKVLFLTMFKLLVHFISADMLPSSRPESSKYFPFVVEAKESTCSSGYVSAKN